MNYKNLAFTVGLLTLACQTSFAANSNPSIEPLLNKAKLVFSDDFNRSEKNNSKEELGKNWKTNSKNRAAGVKQADLKDGKLYIKMAKKANHAVSVLHTAPFNDGIVKVKFNMLTTKGAKFNFNDPKAKNIAHAGHVCSVSIKPNGITIQDQIDGIFRLDINKLRKDKKNAAKNKSQLASLLKGKQATIKGDYTVNQWYDLTMVFQGDVLAVYIDDKKVGQLSSKGLAHVKDNIAFAVNAEVAVDDLEVWSLN